MRKSRKFLKAPGGSAVRPTGSHTHRQSNRQRCSARDNRRILHRRHAAVQRRQRLGPSSSIARGATTGICAASGQPRLCGRPLAAPTSAVTPASAASAAHRLRASPRRSPASPHRAHLRRPAFAAFPKQVAWAGAFFALLKATMNFIAFGRPRAHAPCSRRPWPGTAPREGRPTGGRRSPVPAAVPSIVLACIDQFDGRSASAAASRATKPDEAGLGRPRSLRGRSEHGAGAAVCSRPNQSLNSLYCCSPRAASQRQGRPRPSTSHSAGPRRGKRWRAPHDGANETRHSSLDF